jgi:hypothetical protein
MAMTIARSHVQEGIERIDADWTSDGSGAVTQAINIAGVITRVVTDPGATAPTDNYDLTFIDEFGLDLFAGQGADRDTANSESFCPGVPLKDGTTTSVIPMSHVGTATLTIAAAGDTKVGKIVLFIKVR